MAIIIFFSEYNPCVDSQHNYCDINAACTHSMKSFTCKCQEGFEESASDVSRQTGEQCSGKYLCVFVLNYNLL